MKKMILTISIIFLLVSVFTTNIFATGDYEILAGNTITKPANNTINMIENKIENKNTNNTNSTNNTNKVNNTTNKVNNTNKNSSSYKNTNLPDTGSEDFVIGFVIVAGVISAIYAYIKIKTYNI